MPIPRSAEEWAAVVPNETDERLALGWLLEASGMGMWKGIPGAPERIAAASRLLEKERCVERLAGYFHDENGWPDDFAKARDFAEARRILGVE